MRIVKRGVAGTAESSDIIVRVEPRDKDGIEVFLTSAVMQQFGKHIERVILDTLGALGITSAKVNAVDKGALDCTISARVKAAAYRASDHEDYDWRRMP